MLDTESNYLLNLRHYVKEDHFKVLLTEGHHIHFCPHRQLQQQNLQLLLNRDELLEPFLEDRKNIELQLLQLLLLKYLQIMHQIILLATLELMIPFPGEDPITPLFLFTHNTPPTLE